MGTLCSISSSDLIQNNEPGACNITKGAKFGRNTDRGETKEESFIHEQGNLISSLESPLSEATGIAQLLNLAVRLRK